MSSIDTPVSGRRNAVSKSRPIHVIHHPSLEYEQPPTKSSWEFILVYVPSYILTLGVRGNLVPYIYKGPKNPSEKT